MKRISKFLLFVALTVVAVSCGKDKTREEKVAIMIQQIESPFLVANMNVQTLMDKSQVMEEGTLPYTYYQVISFFLGKELTGIDYNTKAQLVVGEGESFLPSYYGIFKIEDEKVFTELLEVEANADIKEEDGMKYAIKEKEQYCVVWNEEFAIISDVQSGLMALFSGGKDNGDKKVKKLIRIIASAEEGEADPEMLAFLQKDADIAIHFDGEGFYGYMGAMMEIGEAFSDQPKDPSQEAVKDLYKGTLCDMYINFNDGSVDMEIEADFSEDLKEKLNFLADKGVDDKLLNFGKTENPLMTMAYSMDIQGGVDYMKEVNGDDAEEMFEDMENSGMSIDEIQEALTGEFVVMVDEVIKQEEVYDFGYDEPITVKNDKGIFGIVLAVSDKGLIENKIAEIMAKQDVAMNSQEEAAMNKATMELLPNGVIHSGEAFVFLTDAILFASNDSSWTNMVVNGTTKKVKNPEGVLQQKPITMYANLNKLSSMESVEDDQKQIAGMFDSFRMVLDLEGGSLTLKMKDGSKNSLYLLTQAVGAILADVEKMSNPDMEAELEDALQDTEDSFDKLEEDLKQEAH
ncbi:hypothetical protein K6119_01460 [Paracrocinitomix mangrovi]|uniref:hypothetical protein n=1 Tax=Paracrocinitomix mangrovi TaxID=2862509 RepID=UPI001C8F1959|nr:hypothetical protein [Paracrocinitomix mangrovi]UKN02184.1 hypothetical protein K6119_01460 [Paracrocinitomix mangrovi]